MEFSLVSRDIGEQNSPCVVVGVFESNILSKNAAKLDQLSGGYLTEVLKQGDLTGKIGQTLLLPRVPHIASDRVLLVGFGQQTKPLSVREYKQLIQKITKALNETNVTQAVCDFTELLIQDRNIYWNIRFAIETIQDNHYRYDEFKSIKTAPNKLQQVLFQVSEEQKTLVQLALEHAQAVALGVSFAKNVANCPPNVCNPAYLAEQAKALAEEYSQTIKIDIVDEKTMAELGMNAYLAVSRGAKNDAFMSIIKYNNHPDPTAKPIVLVGKGLTFDSGGISIKPADGMDEMKYDMGGAASVYGTMKAIAELNLPLNIIGVLAGCENMSGSDAYRPGDILTTMSGLTVEVLNTDAEGRLVLCDTLTYVERFNPELVIDVATLTGACVVALGAHNSGLISPDTALADLLLNAAEQADDKAWRLPMGEEYQEQLKSNFADLANIGGRWGGAITAGVFLSNFTQKYQWAHLDIAGTAWKQGAEKGATGRPVSLLTQFLINKIA